MRREESIQVFVDLRTVHLGDERVADARVKRQLHIVPGLIQFIKHTAHTLAHIAHGIVFAGDEQNRQVFRHTAVPLVGVDGVQKRAEVDIPLHREREAAQRVVYKAIHFLFLTRHPVVICAVGLEFLVVRARGNLLERRNFRPCALCLFQHIEIRALGLPHGSRNARAGTHEYHCREGVAVGGRKFARDERAHAVAHEKIRQLGIFFAHNALQIALILDDIIEASLFAEMPVERAGGHAAAMAEVIVDDNDKAALRHVFAKRFIQRTMLRHAVRNLQNSLRFAVRLIQAGENFVMCRAGIKCKFGYLHAA